MRQRVGVRWPISAVCPLWCAIRQEIFPVQSDALAQKSRYRPFAYYPAF